MSITISFDPAMQAEPEAEASSREISCEQVVCEAVGDYLQRAKYAHPEYDAWFKAKYEEGKAAYARGDFRTNEEVEREAALRRAKLKARIVSVQ